MALPTVRALLLAALPALLSCHSTSQQYCENACSYYQTCILKGMFAPDCQSKCESMWSEREFATSVEFCSNCIGGRTTCQEVADACGGRCDPVVARLK
jgi:hypothetical protein